MKKIVLALTLMFGLYFVQAQEAFIAKVQYGQLFTVDNYDVEFVKVISDSRCPSGVDCIRAGEAKVLVNIFENGELLTSKELIFHASGVINKNAMTLLKSEDIVIEGLRLIPYPEVHHRIPEKMYCLEIQVI
jgi:hypothetical protein